MQRLPGIDLPCTPVRVVFRGLAIVFMVLANYLAGPAGVPGWLKHAPDAGLTIIDLIAPFFIFAIGLTYGLSVWRRSARDGWRAAAAHFALRYLALIGLGALLSTGEFFFGLDPSGINWGVLQAIGVAGLVTLAFMRAPVWLRAAVGLALLAGYQIALENGLRAVVLGMPHGGLPGAMAWSAMLLLATVLADLYHAGQLREPVWLRLPLWPWDWVWPSWGWWSARTGSRLRTCWSAWGRVISGRGMGADPHHVAPGLGPQPAALIPAA